MLELLWNAPVSEEKTTKIIEILQLSANSRVLDIGCGCGEVLIRIAERYRIYGTGIDSSTDHIDAARSRVKSRASGSQMKFVVVNAQNYPVESQSLDLVLCLGATHAFGLGAGAYQNAIESMIPLVTTGGLLLIADGYMKQPAPPEYRKLLGDSMPDEMTHAANVATGRELGLIPLAAWTASLDEWDDFEWTYQRVIERRCKLDPQNLQLSSKLAQRREWMDAYLRFGRDTLGYGTYLFEKNGDHR